MLSYRARKSHWKVKCGFSFGSSKYCGSSWAAAPAAARSAANARASRVRRLKTDPVTRVSASYSSLTLWNRSRGSFCMHFRMICETFGSIFGLRACGEGGFSWMCLSTTASGVSPSKGSVPVKTS